METETDVADTLKKPVAKTVQAYIDETPFWEDGTAVDTMMMTGVQWRIWWLAAAGKFFEGMVVFMSGVALPLIAREFDIGAAGHGLVGASVLFGILIGASLLGGLADLFGRRRMFIVEMVLFILFLLLVTVSNGFPMLLIAMFGLGVALGCDYPTAHLVISESISSKARGRMVLGAFAFQAVGALVGTGLAYAVLSNFPTVEAWRYMYGAAILPAAIVLFGRFFIPESPHWLATRGRNDMAKSALRFLLSREPVYPSDFDLKTGDGDGGGAGDHGMGSQFKAIARLFVDKKTRRATILASVPWFLQDLGTYGIGIFTPVILASILGHQAAHETSLSTVVHNDLLAAKGAAIIDVLLIVGIVFAVLLADRVGRIRLQIAGFIGCAVGLALAAASTHAGPGFEVPLIFAGFMLFNFMTNMGPNAQTYLLAGEVFPTECRAVGAGFAASFAKIGAVMTAFLFPVLLSDIGQDALLMGLIITSLLGAAVTFAFRIETKGVSLEDVAN
ncbi:MFS transporter [Roseibium aquae]|uniref:MFS transporter n=1 Tax=Roseibium aquae TaxID=1323746 RepID=A0A916T9B1_9HYPH|nr:MFS transporter [Roseibium aquae]GGB35578.1 MFS transporter [Roseibium aquae]